MIQENEKLLAESLEPTTHTTGIAEQFFATTGSFGSVEDMTGGMSASMSMSSTQRCAAGAPSILQHAPA